MNNNKLMKTIRKKTGLTQNEFCKILGITQVYLSYLETGNRRPSANLAYKFKNLAIKLGMDVSLEDIIL